MGDENIQNFLLRCGLDETAAPLLQELSDEGLQKGLTNFDPSGTKDGNVLGRLEGYVRHAKRGSGHSNGAPLHSMSAAPPPDSYGAQAALPPNVSSKAPLQEVTGDREVDIPTFLARCDLDETAGGLLE